MSRIIQQIASLQFQMDSRKVTASMDALQAKATELNQSIAAVNKGISALGQVSPDNKFLQEYQQQLRRLTSDLNDVTAAQRDLMKGVKAADQLWQAAKLQDIEGLSIKAIKAGQSGLRKRMENLRPELGGDEAKLYAAYKAVIEEADRVIKVFQADAAGVVQVIRDGGIVSEQVMKRTRDALKEMIETEREGSVEQRQLLQQYDVLNESLTHIAETRRREKGEIVSANDARREAQKLTEEGIAAARREREAADTVIAGIQQQKEKLDELRRSHDERISQTEEEIATNQRLEEAELQRLADIEKGIRYNENEDRKSAERLRKRAEAAKAAAEAKAQAAEAEIEQEKLLRQHAKEAGDEVTALTEKMEELGKVEAPKSNPTLESIKTGAEQASASIEELEERVEHLRIESVNTRYHAGIGSSPRDYLSKWENAFEEVFAKNHPGWGTFEYRTGKAFEKLQAAGITKKMQDAYEAFAERGFTYKGSVYSGEYFGGMRDIESRIRMLKEYFGELKGEMLDFMKGSFLRGIKDTPVDIVKKKLEDLKSIASDPEDWELIPKREQQAITFMIQNFEKLIPLMEETQAITKERNDAFEREFLEWQKEHTLEDYAAPRIAAHKAEWDPKVEEADRRYKEAEEELRIMKEGTTATNDQTEAIRKQGEELKRQAEVKGQALRDLGTDGEKLAGDLRKVDEELEALGKSTEQSQQDVAAIGRMKGEVETLTSAIEELKKQRDDLTASQEKGAAAAKAEGEAIRMTAKEAAEALAAMTQKSTFRATGNVTTEFSNLEQAQNYLLGLIKKVVEKNGGEITNAGAWQLENQHQIDEVVAAFQTNYGMKGDRSGAMDIIRRLVTGSNGGLIKSGKMQDHWLSVIPDQEALDARVARIKELLAISKGQTVATQQQTAAAEQNAQAEQKRAEVENQLATVTAQINTLEEQRQKIEQQIAQAEQQSEKATEESTEAVRRKKEEVEKLEDDLERIQHALQREQASMQQEQGWLNESLEALDEMGLKEADLADEAKVREAVEKKVLEIMQSQAKEEQEIAEQRKKLTAEIKMSDLGGTKADQAFYAERKDLYLAEYKDIDEMMERVAHLEKVSKLRTGRKFSDDTSWSPGDELDEDEAIVMTEKEKQAALDELRILKHHIREIILKSIREVGDITKGIEKATGGDGVDEESSFGEKLNDRLSALKEKIEERIHTTLDDYEELVDESLRDDSGKPIDKEKLTTTISRRIENLRQEISEGRSAIGASETDIAEIKQELAAKEQEIELAKQATAATEKSTEAERKREELLRQRSELEGRLQENQGRQAQLQQELNAIHAQAAETERELGKAEQQAAAAAEAAVETDKERAQLEEELKAKTEASAKAAGEYEAQQKKSSKAMADANKAEAEAIRLDGDAAAAEERVATAEERRIATMDREGARLREIRADGTRLLDVWEQQKKERQETDQAWADADEKQREAEIRKAQSQEVTAKSLEDSIRQLKEANSVIDANSDEWAENTRIIQSLQAALDEVSQKQKEMMGEWMSYGDAMKYASSIGSEGFMATDEQTKMATDALIRHRKELIKTIQQKEADSQATSSERSELEQLDQALTKIKTGFASADEVLARFGEHMNAGKDASEGMVQTLDEQLAGATSEFDENIKYSSEYVDYYELQLREATDELERMEAELAKLEKKHKSGDFVTKEEIEDLSRIAELRERIGNGEITPAPNGGVYVDGQKALVEYLKQQKAASQQDLDYWKQQKAKELGLTEQVEKKKQDAQRLTQEQMQEGIKLLEEEYRATDHTTEEDIKRREALRMTIDQMNQEIKESTGEWMSLAQAEELASKAGTSGFYATTQQMTQATQAIERQRDALVKTIQQKQRDGEATRKEEEELLRLEKVLKDLKFEQDNFNMSHKRMDDILKVPKDAGDIETLRAAIRRADGELRRMEDSLQGNTQEYKKMAKEVKEAKNVLKEMEGQAKATTSTFDKAWSRLKTYVGLYVSAAVAMQKITSTMGDLMELSDRMGEVRKTTGFTADEVGRLSDNLKKLDVRTSLTSLMELSSLAGSVGLKTQQDVQGFTEAANQLLIALPEMGNESARTLIKIAQATGDLQKNNNDVRETLEKVGSTIIALRANSASAAGPITDFVSRVGAVGAQAGISIDQIAALGSTIDALGGRVEMSATALSRMIPAIRNNTFEVARAIGMTEKELKGMSAMEQMVTIFQKLRDGVKQYNTDTEEGMNAMADNVEAVLSKSPVMAEVMKELNQQGARAGIVFGLLSQNVDELQKQLGIAGDAYKDNIALQEEFNKMNETAAAKWARLKNQLEEMFVSDSAQRRLGNIIDLLRKVVDLVSMDGPIGSFIRYSILFAAFMKMKWTEAFGSAMISVWKFTHSEEVSTAATVADTAAKEANATATMAAGNAAEGAAKKTAIFGKAWGKMSETMKANVITAVAMALWYLGSALLDTFEKARQAAAAINRVKEKTDEEREAVEKLFNPLRDANTAEEEKSRLISEINSKYGSYLGKMLTEASNANEIARAYKAINLQLERKNTLEGMEENKKRVEDNRRKELDSVFGELDKYVMAGAVSPTEGAQLSADITGIIKKGIEDGLSKADVRAKVGELLQGKAQGGSLKQRTMSMQAGYASWVNTQDLLKGLAMEYYDTQLSVQNEVKTANKRLQADMDNIKKKVQETAEEDIPTLFKTFGTAMNKGTDAKKYNANESYAVVQAFEAIKSYYDLRKDDLSDDQRERITSVLGTDISEFRKKAVSGGTGGGGDKPYGDFNRVTSAYGEWDADSLVARRKEMLERVRSLANGADVQAVLSEDAKFISEAVRKNIKTTKDAIEWYNAERLKIQEALHEKHLTNTGDWLDPTSQKGRKKTLEAEWKAYIDELDAFYTERKAKIQEARNDELISEAEAWRRTLQNEAEWRQRRAELQQLYANKSAEVTEEEQAAIFDILAERTGETTDYIQKDIAQTVKFILRIGEKSKDEMEKILGQLDKRIEQDFLRQRTAIGKQVQAIADIIEKERPFNGITENLRENLTKMGALLGDFEKRREALLAKKESTKELDEEQVREESKRITFLLQEAENAYNTNIQEVMRRMAEAGMKEWVKVFKDNPQMQEALMAQLHSTFDRIQEAIKKEAQLWKKEAENMWNNILMPDGQTTLKQVADKVVAQLSLDQGRVSRANGLIGAGQASERVADKLAIQQMKVELALQQHYYDIMRKRGQATIDDLEHQAALAKQRGDTEAATKATLDAQHARMTLNLATAKEETELAKQREAIIARAEESQARLYTQLREYANVLSSTFKDVFEASNTGQADFYTEQAKKRLTGEPTSGLYIVVENAGTEDAEASYRTLTDEEALKIDQENATREAWRKMMDEISEKMNDAITDQLNAMLQNASVDANTQATLANTEALQGLTGAMSGSKASIDTSFASSQGLEVADVVDEITPPTPTATTPLTTPPAEADTLPMSPALINPGSEDIFGVYNDEANAAEESAERQIEAYDKVKYALERNFNDQKREATKSNDAIAKSTQSTFAKMTAAANLYGAAYQAMSNDNLSAEQKFEMIALQAAGNAAISAVTASLSKATGQTASNMPAIASEAFKMNPIAGAAIFAAISAVLGGLLGFAASKVTKSKAEIAAVTGASSSAGRMVTGMLTYGEGNVQEVVGNDGVTYRARRVGRIRRTHITRQTELTEVSGQPAIVGEKGSELVVPAATTRRLQMNYPGILKAISLVERQGSLGGYGYGGGQRVRRYADGNVEDVAEMAGRANGTGMVPEDINSLRGSIDNAAAAYDRLTEQLKKPVHINMYGPDGLRAKNSEADRYERKYGKSY